MASPTTARSKARSPPLQRNVFKDVVSSDAALDLPSIDPPRWGWTATGGVAELLPPAEGARRREGRKSFLRDRRRRVAPVDNAEGGGNDGPSAQTVAETSVAKEQQRAGVEERPPARHDSQSDDPAVLVSAPESIIPASSSLPANPLVGDDDPGRTCESSVSREKSGGDDGDGDERGRVSSGPSSPAATNDITVREADDGGTVVLIKMNPSGGNDGDDGAGAGAGGGDRPDPPDGGKSPDDTEGHRPGRDGSDEIHAEVAPLSLDGYHPDLVWGDEARDPDTGELVADNGQGQLTSELDTNHSWDPDTVARVTIRFPLDETDESCEDTDSDESDEEMGKKDDSPGHMNEGNRDLSPDPGEGDFVNVNGDDDCGMTSGRGRGRLQRKSSRRSSTGSVSGTVSNRASRGGRSLRRQSSSNLRENAKSCEVHEGVSDRSKSAYTSTRLSSSQQDRIRKKEYFSEVVDWDVGDPATPTPLAFATQTAVEYGLSSQEVLDLCQDIQNQIQRFCVEKLCYRPPIVRADPFGRVRSYDDVDYEVFTLYGGRGRPGVGRGQGARGKQPRGGGNRSAMQGPLPPSQLPTHSRPPVRKGGGFLVSSVKFSHEPEWRQEVLRRLKAESTADLSSGDGGGAMQLHTNHVCHICHARKKAVIVFGCGIPSHAYCDFHCQNRLGISYEGVREGTDELKYCPICALVCVCPKCGRRLDSICGDLKKECCVQQKDMHSVDMAVLPLSTGRKPGQTTPGHKRGGGVRGGAVDTPTSAGKAGRPKRKRTHEDAFESPSSAARADDGASGKKDRDDGTSGKKDRDDGTSRKKDRDADRAVGRRRKKRALKQNPPDSSELPFEVCQGELLDEHERASKNDWVPAVVPDAEDENVDYCMVCNNHGEVTCCDKCPRAFHLACLDVAIPEEGEWTCPMCVRDSSPQQSDCITGEGSLDLISAAFHNFEYGDGYARHMGVLCKLHEMILVLMEFDFGYIFRQPVDVAECDDYLDVIENPMDLGTIAKRIVNSGYNEVLLRHQEKSDATTLCTDRESSGVDNNKTLPKDIRNGSGSSSKASAFSGADAEVDGQNLAGPMQMQMQQRTEEHGNQVTQSFGGPRSEPNVESQPLEQSGNHVGLQSNRPDHVGPPDQVKQQCLAGKGQEQQSEMPLLTDDGKARDCLASHVPLESHRGPLTSEGVGEDSQQQSMHLLNEVILQILKDVELVWHNCFVYNHEKSSIYRMAEVQRRKYLTIRSCSFDDDLDPIVRSQLNEFVAKLGASRKTNDDGSQKEAIHVIMVAPSHGGYPRRVAVYDPSTRKVLKSYSCIKSACLAAAYLSKKLGYETEFPLTDYTIKRLIKRSATDPTQRLFGYRWLYESDLESGSVVMAESAVPKQNDVLMADQLAVASASISDTAALAAACGQSSLDTCTQSQSNGAPPPLSIALNGATGRKGCAGVDQTHHVERVGQDNIRTTFVSIEAAFAATVAENPDCAGTTTLTEFKQALSDSSGNANGPIDWIPLIGFRWKVPCASGGARVNGSSSSSTTTTMQQRQDNGKPLLSLVLPQNNLFVEDGVGRSSPNSIIVKENIVSCSKLAGFNTLEAAYHDWLQTREASGLTSDDKCDLDDFRVFYLDGDRNINGIQWKSIQAAFLPVNQPLSEPCTVAPPLDNSTWGLPNSTGKPTGESLENDGAPGESTSKTVATTVAAPPINTADSSLHINELCAAKVAMEGDREATSVHST